MGCVYNPLFTIAWQIDSKHLRPSRTRNYHPKKKRLILKMRNVCVASLRGYF